MRFLPILLAFVCVLPVWGSEPGEPIDCSDFVALQPGFTCTASNASAFPDTGGRVADNARHILSSGTVIVYEDCWGSELLGVRINQRDYMGGGDETIGYFNAHCLGIYNDLARGDVTYRDSTGPIYFDEENGRLLIGLQSQCNYENSPFGPCPYGPVVNWTAMIEGFATTFEILQTYTPTASEISFRVPYMPEGLQHADWFDTYYGDLATVGDWSQAQPLQCGYPATAPSVGDYLTVPDTTPTPPPGHGYYYVTAVNHQGQRRYGRKASGGVLSGRAPAVLPACE